MTDPVERRLEALFDRPIPPDLGQLIDARVRKAAADASLRSSGLTSDGPWWRMAARRRRLVLALAATGLLVAGGATIATSLLRGDVPPVMPDVTRAMAGVRERTMSECLDKEEAKQLIGARLGKEGVTDWSIRTDGPIAHPIGEGEAMRQHMAAGCYVYSGVGWDANGRPVVYLAGPDS